MLVRLQGLAAASAQWSLPTSPGCIQQFLQDLYYNIFNGLPKTGWEDKLLNEKLYSAVTLDICQMAEKWIKVWVISGIEPGNFLWSVSERCTQSFCLQHQSWNLMMTMQGITLPSTVTITSNSARLEKTQAESGALLQTWSWPKQ